MVEKNTVKKGSQKLKETKYSGFGVVRDKDGNVKVDDISQLHPVQISLLTEEEKFELGVWRGVFGLDAEGWKKLTQVSVDTFRAEENIVALTGVLVNFNLLRIQPRIDLQSGSTLKIRN